MNDRDRPRQKERKRETASVGWSVWELGREREREEGRAARSSKPITIEHLSK